MNLNYLVILLAIMLIVWGGSSLVFVFSSIRKAITGLELIGHIAKALSLVLVGIILALLFWPSNTSEVHGVNSSGSSMKGVLKLAGKNQAIVDPALLAELQNSDAFKEKVYAALADSVLDSKIIPMSFAKSITDRYSEKLDIIDGNPTLRSAIGQDDTKGVYFPLRQITAAIGHQWGPKAFDSDRLDNAGLYIEFATYHDNADVSELSAIDLAKVQKKNNQNTVVVRLAEPELDPSTKQQIKIVDPNYYNLGTLCPKMCPD